MKVYIAAPLFNKMERTRNIKLNNKLKFLGFDTYLPQEDGGLSYDMIKNYPKSKTEIRNKLFRLDYEAVMECDIIICLLDGRTPDEGTCIELGMAYAMKKVCVGLKTDSRAMDENGDNNIMLDDGENFFAGMERSIYFLTKGLIENGHEVIIYTGQMRKKVKPCKYKVIYDDSLIKHIKRTKGSVDDQIKAHYLKYNKRIKNNFLKIYNKENPDYILVQDHLWGIIPHINIFKEIKCNIGYCFTCRLTI